MFPKQKIPVREKTREWKRNSIEWFAKNSFSNSRNVDVVKLFEIAAGIADYTIYEYVENPFNLKGDQFKHYPAKLRRFDIISPIFLRIKSEYEKRPFEPIVFTRNSNFESERQEFEKQLILKSLQERFINRMVETGQIDPSQQQEVQSPDVIKNQVSSLKDIETIEGQTVLDYVIDREKIERKYSNEFYNFIVSHKTITYKDVYNDEVIKKTIHPANFQWSESAGLEFIEDANVVSCSWEMSFEDVISIFQGEFKKYGYNEEEALDELESNWNQTSSVGDGFLNTYMKNRHNTPIQSGMLTSRQMNVQHVQWTSYRYVYILGYDEQSNPIVVDETYSGEYESARWQEEIREGYIINNKYYIGGDCVEFPVYDALDPFKAKKNYTGRVFMNNIVQQTTLPEKLMQFQESYDVIKWKLQYTINKNKDKLAVVPMGLLANTFKPDSYTDEQVGGTHGDIKEFERQQLDNNPIAQTLYFADTTQLLFVDETSENAQLAAGLIKVLDLGLGNYIEFLMSLLASIKAEAEDVVGFNRFTTGDYDKKDAVRNVQAGLRQSSVIIELYYSEFQDYVQNDLQGIIDRAPFAYKEGRALTFTRNNTSIERLKLSDRFAASSKGIFIKNSRKTQEILDMLKQESTSMLQNGMRHSTWGKMISGSNNYASIIQEIEKAEIEIQQQAQAQQEADRNNSVQIQQMISQDKEADRELEKYKIDIGAEVSINKTIATMQSFALNGEDEVGDLAALEEVRRKQLNDLQNTQLEYTRLQSVERNEKVKADAKKYSDDSKLKVAKENKAR